MRGLVHSSTSRVQGTTNSIPSFPVAAAVAIDANDANTNSRVFDGSNEAEDAEGFLHKLEYKVCRGCICGIGLSADCDHDFFLCATTQAELLPNVFSLDENTLVTAVTCVSLTESDLSVSVSNVFAAEGWVAGVILVGHDPAWRCVDASGAYESFIRKIMRVDNISVGSYVYSGGNDVPFDAFEHFPVQPAMIHFTTAPLPFGACFSSLKATYTRLRPKVSAAPSPSHTLYSPSRDAPSSGLESVGGEHGRRLCGWSDPWNCINPCAGSTICGCGKCDVGCIANCIAQALLHAAENVALSIWHSLRFTVTSTTTLKSVFGYSPGFNFNPTSRKADKSPLSLKQLAEMFGFGNPPPQYEPNPAKEGSVKQTTEYDNYFGTGDATSIAGDCINWYAGVELDLVLTLGGIDHFLVEFIVDLVFDANFQLFFPWGGGGGFKKGVHGALDIPVFSELINQQKIAVGPVNFKFTATFYMTLNIGPVSAQGFAMQLPGKSGVQ